MLSYVVAMGCFDASSDWPCSWKEFQVARGKMRKTQGGTPDARWHSGTSHFLRHECISHESDPHPCRAFPLLVCYSPQEYNRDNMTGCIRLAAPSPPGPPPHASQCETICSMAPVRSQRGHARRHSLRLPANTSAHGLLQPYVTRTVCHAALDEPSGRKQRHGASGSAYLHRLRRAAPPQLLFVAAAGSCTLASIVAAVGSLHPRPARPPSSAIRVMVIVAF